MVLPAWLGNIFEIAFGDWIGSNMTATVIFGALLLVGIVVRWLRHRANRKGWNVGGDDLILIGLVGMVVFSVLAGGGYVWQRFSPHSLIRVSTSAPSSEQIGSFATDFERIAAEESYMAVAMRGTLRYSRYDKPGEPQPDVMRHISEGERKDWAEYLQKLDRDCEALRFTETHDAIVESLKYFADSYAPDATLITSYNAYHHVSTTLKAELARKGFALPAASEK